MDYTSAALQHLHYKLQEHCFYICVSIILVFIHSTFTLCLSEHSCDCDRLIKIRFRQSLNANDGNLKAEDECTPGGVFWWQSKRTLGQLPTNSQDELLNAWLCTVRANIIQSSLWKAIKGKSLLYCNYTAMYLCQDKMPKRKEGLLSTVITFLCQTDQV